jgi:hypothetical protein
LFLQEMTMMQIETAAARPVPFNNLLDNIIIEVFG